MNSLADLYTLSMKINGITTRIGPNDLNISITDSIYSIYPKVVFEIIDSSGIFLESRITTLGLPITFTLGYDKKIIKLPFIIDHFETTAGENNQRLSGVINIHLVHELISKFKIDSKAYSKTPSEIIQELLKGKISSTSIEECQKLQIAPYYNPHYTFEEFIEKVLLINSISKENSYDPYFCFIDVSNTFNYKTISKMYKTAAKSTLFLSSENRGKEANEKILSFLPFSQSLQKNISNLYAETFHIDEEDSTKIVKQNLSILDSNLTSNYPIISKNKKIRSINLSSLNQENFETNINKFIIKKKNYLLPEKVLIHTLLNTSLKAGSTINLDVKYEAGHSSIVYSGKYLIEKSQHSWDKTSMKGYTSLVVSRPNFIIPSASKIKPGDLLS